MKIRHKVAIILFLLMSYIMANPSQVSAQRGNVNFQIFYDQLSPYGEWTRNSDYGYIWIPDVGPEFSPYSTDGSWVMTDYGWTWVSDYPWGWAPFHYGRWDFDNYYGWFWVPDNVWGPSWVTWRSGNGYYGWAPMRPGISLSMSFGSGYDNSNHWNFVRDRDFGRRNQGQYFVDRRDNDRIFRSSAVIKNTYNDNNRNVTYISGPRRDEVQRLSGRRISNVTIRDNNQPGQRLSRNQLDIYRPQFDRNSDARERSAPSRVSEMKDIRPPAERNSGNRRNVQIQQQQQQQQRQQPAVNRQEQIRQSDQKQPVENRRNNVQRQKDQQSQQQQMQQQQQVQQQSETRRQDEQKQKEQQQQQVQQQQQQQVQQQSENRRQDEQKQKEQQQQQQQQLQQQQQQQSVQQNERRRQEVSGSARSRRMERQQNKANAADKRIKNDENPKQDKR